jgi:RNA polymerase sigma factor (sigma-70 family)
MNDTQTVFDTSTVLMEIDEPAGSERDPRRESTGMGLLPVQRGIRNFERDCERLRPLGEAFVMRRFSGSLNRADAEDAVSDAIIRLHRRMLKGRAPDNLRAIFFTSVRNAAIDQLRSRAAKPTVGLEAAATVPSGGPMPLEHAEGREDAVRLQEALKRMRGNYREAIVLRFGLGMTVPEIAQRLSISLPAAKKLVLRATQQVKKRLESIEGSEFCPEMREMARRSLLEQETCGQSSKAEDGIMQAHFQHCGSCKSFLANLHDNLHEVGSAAVVGTVATQQIDSKIGISSHLARWAGEVVQGAQAGAGKMRLAVYKATGAFQSTDSTTAGLLSGTGQKIAAICSTGAATTATCVLAGVAGPGVGVSTPPPQNAPAPPAIVRAEQSAAAAEEAPAPETSPEALPEAGPEPPPVPSEPAPAEAPESSPAPKPAPVQSAPSSPEVAEFGFEGGPTGAPAPVTTSGSGESSGSSSQSSSGESGDLGGAGFGGGSVSAARGVGGAIGFQK